MNRDGAKRIIRNNDGYNETIYINESKRTVACVVKYGKLYHSPRSSDKMSFDEGKLVLYKYQERAVGIAKCSPKDEWNDDTGMRLAECRALKKMYQAMWQEENRTSKAIARVFEDNLECSNRRAERYCKEWHYLNKKEKEIMGGGGNA